MKKEMMPSKSTGMFSKYVYILFIILLYFIVFTIIVKFIVDKQLLKLKKTNQKLK